MKRLFSILVFLALLQPLKVVADDDTIPTDSLEVSQNDSTEVEIETPKQKIALSDIDQSDKQLQKRYFTLSGDTLWKHTPWFKRFSAGLSTGLNMFNNYEENRSQIPFNFYVGYKITPIHEVRGQFGFASSDNNITGLTSTTLSGEVQYLTHIFDYIKGYQPYRIFDLSSMFAIGSTFKASNSVYAKVGVEASANFGPISLFVQPHVGFIKDYNTPFAQQNPARLNIRYGLNAGIAARMADMNDYFKNQPENVRNFFVEGTTGWSFNNMGFSTRQSGTEYNVNVGRWFDPAVGLRGGMAFDESYWGSTPGENGTTNWHKRLNAAGRVELMFNPLGLMSKYRESKKEPLFETALTAGIQFGYSISDYEQQKNYKKPFYGLTAAAQGLVRVSPGSYIVFGPRITNNVLSVPHAFGSAGNVISERTENDRYVTFNVGARIYARSKADRPAYEGGFIPHWWAGADMGGSKILQDIKTTVGSKGSYLPSFGLNLGYDFNRWTTLRLQAQMAQFSRTDGLEKNNYNKLDVRLIYMFPFEQLLRGFEPEQKLHVYLEAGPVFGIYAGHRKIDVKSGELMSNPNPESGKVALGAMGGVMVSYDFRKDLSKQYWDIFAEFQGQVQQRTVDNGNFDLPIPGTSRRANLQYGLSIGTRYHFLPMGKEKFEELNLDVPAWMGRWFVEAGYGWQMPLGVGNMLRSSGSAFKGTVGRWILPYLGARGGVFAQQNYNIYNQNTDNYHAQMYAGLSAELIANPLNYFPRMRAQESRMFDMNMGVGFTLGLQRKSFSPKVGFTASLQGLYRVAPGLQIYVEPRFQTYGNFYNMPGAEGVTNKYLSMNVGTRITNVDKFYYYSEIENIEFAPHLWYGAQIGGGRYATRDKSGAGKHVGFQPIVNFDLGYDLNHLFSIRGQLEYQLQGNKPAEGGNIKHFSLVDARAIGMFNLTNFWQDTRKTPRLSFYPEVGLTLSKYQLRVTPGVMGGAYAALRISKHLDIVNEAQLQANVRSVNPGQGADGGMVNRFKWSITAGTRYHLDPIDKDKFQELNLGVPDYMGKWFMEASYGWVLPTSAGGSPLRAGGTTYRANVGRWFLSFLGARVGLQASQHYNTSSLVNATVDQEGTTKNFKQYHAQIFGVGSFEVLANPLNFFPSLREQFERDFDVNISAGFNLGLQHTSSNGRTPQLGFTAGVQALYQVSPGIHIFVEPRFQTSEHHRSSAYHAYQADKMFSLSVGTRVTRMDKYLFESEMNNKDFESHMWYGVQFGGSHNLIKHKTIGDKTVNMQPMFNLNFGYDLTHWASLKATLEYASQGKVSNDYQKINRGNLWDMRVMGMLNLTNLWQGTKGSPRLSFYPEGGVALTKAPNQFTYALVGGAYAAYRITDHLDLTTETYLQMNRRSSSVPGYIDGFGKLSHFKWGISAGTRYHLDHIDKAKFEELKLGVPDYMGKLFMEASYGWVLPTTAGGKVATAGGSTYKLAVGRWFLSFLGARVGMQASQHYNTTHRADVIIDEETGATKNLKHYNAQILGVGSIELLANPINFFPSMREQFSRDFDVNLSMGLTLGAQQSTGYGHTFQAGFTAGLQALYQVSPGIHFFVEPRFQTSGHNKSADIKTYQSDKMWTLNVGTRITRMDKYLYEAEMNNTDFERSLWVGFQAGATHNLIKHKAMGKQAVSMQPLFDLSVGYDLTPYTTIKAQVDFSTQGKPTADYEKVNRYGVWDVRLMDMFNITNLWQGTKTSPRLSLYPEVGVAFSNVHNKYTLGVVGGAYAAYRVADDWDLITETTLQMNHRAGAVPGYIDGLGRLSHFKWGITAGTRYHLRDISIKARPVNLDPESYGWFLEAAQGFNIPLAEDHKGGHLMGTNWELKAGYMFNGYLGVKGGMDVSQSYVNQNGGKQEDLFGAVGVTAELVAAPIKYLSMANPDSKIALNLSAGFQAGLMCKGSQDERHFAKGFKGITAAAQVLYKLLPGASLFVEPRYATAQFYHGTADDVEGAREAAKHLSLNMGIRVEHQDKTDRDLANNQNEESSPLWVAGSFGGMKSFQTHKVCNDGMGFNPAINFAVGYDLNAASAFKFQMGINVYNFANTDSYYTLTEDGTSHVGNVNYTVPMLNMRLAYMYDLVRAFHGSSPLKAYVEFGPTYSWNLGDGRSLDKQDENHGKDFKVGNKPYYKKSSAGLMAGVLFSMRINSQFDVTLESLGNLHMNLGYMPYISARPLANMTTELSVGTRYHF